MLRNYWWFRFIFLNREINLSDVNFKLGLFSVKINLHLWYYIDSTVEYCKYCMIVLKYKKERPSQCQLHVNFTNRCISYYKDFSIFYILGLTDREWCLYMYYFSYRQYTILYNEK